MCKVRSLLKKCADVNAKNERGETPIHWVAYKGNREIVKLLLTHGAHLNAITTKKWLDYPAGSILLDVVKIARKDKIVSLLYFTPTVEDVILRALKKNIKNAYCFTLVCCAGSYNTSFFS